MPNHLNDLEPFQLVKTYQALTHFRTGWNDNKDECHFSHSRYFTEKTIIAKPLYSKFSNDKKHKVLTWINTLLKQVKSYFDNNPNPAKVNVTDSTKDNFAHSLIVKEILVRNF